MSEDNDIEDWEDYENWKPLYETIDEARNEIKRLRELLEKALVYSHSMPTTLVAAIEKEVGDD